MAKFEAHIKNYKKGVNNEVEIFIECIDVNDFFLLLCKKLL